MDQKTKTDKVWPCESVGKLKGIGHQAKAKMNELSIHTISDLQLHVCHHGIPKVPIRGFGQIYDIAIQNLLGNPSPYFKDHSKAKHPYLSQYGEIWVEKLNSSTAMPTFCCINDLICFMMKSREDDEEVSAQGQFLHRPRCVQKRIIERICLSAKH